MKSSKARCAFPRNVGRESAEGPVFEKGRPKALNREQLARLEHLYFNSRFSLRELGDMLGVSKMTVWRAAQNGFYG
ncbi:MAG: hypothetical protein ACP5NX_02010 [Candidatus Bilamarchaeaceae archaeon]